MSKMCGLMHVSDEFIDSRMQNFDFDFVNFEKKCLFLAADPSGFDLIGCHSGKLIESLAIFLIIYLHLFCISSNATFALRSTMVR